MSRFMCVCQWYRRGSGAVRIDIWESENVTSQSTHNTSLPLSLPTFVQLCIWAHTCKFVKVVGVYDCKHRASDTKKYLSWCVSTTYKKHSSDSNVSLGHLSYRCRINIVFEWFVTDVCCWKCLVSLNSETTWWRHERTRWSRVLTKTGEWFKIRGNKGDTHKCITLLWRYSQMHHLTLEILTIT